VFSCTNYHLILAPKAGAKGEGSAPDAVLVALHPTIPLAGGRRHGLLARCCCRYALSRCHEGVLAGTTTFSSECSAIRIGWRHNVLWDGDEDILRRRVEITSRSTVTYDGGRTDARPRASARAPPSIPPSSFELGRGDANPWLRAARRRAGSWLGRAGILVVGRGRPERISRRNISVRGLPRGVCAIPRSRNPKFQARRHDCLRATRSVPLRTSRNTTELHRIGRK